MTSYFNACDVIVAHSTTKMFYRFLTITCAPSTLKRFRYPCLQYKPMLLLQESRQCAADVQSDRKFTTVVIIWRRLKLNSVNSKQLLSSRLRHVDMK